MDWFKQKFNQRIQKTIIVLGVLVLAWLILIYQQSQAKAAAGINKQLNYQGKLTNSSGVAVADATYNLKFVIYNAASGGTCLWTAVGACNSSDYGTTTATLVNGVFSVTLGGTGQNSLATSSVNWNNDSLYLGVTVRGTTASPIYDDEMSPRKQITAAAYAFNADTVDGLHATSSEAVANYLIALDARKVLNLWDGGVSSTKATTSSFVYIAPRQDYKTVDNLDRENGDLYVGGDAEFDGKVYFATSTFTQIPSQPHTFGAWAIGVANSNVADAALYINPSVAVSDANLLGLAVAGSVKFLVDVEGDVFANNLTLAGSQTLSTSTISTLVVENNSYLGDANNSDWTHIKGSAWIDTNKPGTTLSSTALVITQQGTGNYFEVSNGSLYYAGTRYFTITNAGVASSTQLFVSNGATTTNYLVVGTASDVVNNLDFVKDLYVADDIEFDGELFGSTARLSVLNASTTNLDTLRLFTELRAPTINATSTVFDHVTSTDRVYVGNTLSVATSTPYPGYEFTVGGDGVFSGNLLVEKSSTTTDRIYAGAQLSVATSTPYPGFEFAVSGDGVFSGNLLVDKSSTTTDRIYVGSQLSVATSTPFPGYELTVSGDGFFSGNLTADGELIVPTARITSLNSTTTNVGTLTVYTGSTFSGLTTFTDLRATTLNATTTNIDSLRLFTELRAPTINATSTVFDHVTSTDRVYVGNSLSVATSTPYPGFAFTVSGSGVFSNNLLVEKSSTTTDRFYTGGQLSVATSTPYPGFEFAVSGDGVFSGNLLVDKSATTTDRIYVGSQLSVATTTPWDGMELTITGDAAISSTLTVGGGAQTATSTTIYGGAIIDDTTLVINANENRVGIGTANPLAPLQVKGTAFTTAYNSYTGLFIDSGDVTAGSGNYGSGIEFTKLGSSSVKKAGIVPVQTTADDDNVGLAFLVSQSGIATDAIVEYMRITSGGNVGIGDTSPLSLFTVGSGDKFRVDNSGNATTSGWLVVGTTAPTPNPLPAGSLFVGASATTTDRMYVGSQLSVATTTPFPAYELTVGGDAALSGNLLVSGGDIGISADTNLIQLAVNQVTINGELISTNGRISVLNASTTNINTLRLFTELRAPTINATSTVFDHVTSTDRVYVGSTLSVATSTPFPGYEFTVTGDGFFSGNLLVDKSATTTDRIYVGSQLSVATSTPFTGFELAVTGDGAFSGNLRTDLDLYVGGSDIIASASGWGDVKWLEYGWISGAPSNFTRIWTADNTNDWLELAESSHSLWLNDNTNGKIFAIDPSGNASTTGKLVLNATKDKADWNSPTNTLTVVGSGYFTTDFRVSGNATTSGYLVIGTTNPTQPNMRAGDLLIGHSATVTDRLYVNSSFSIATSTPWPGAAFTMNGNFAIKGSGTTTDSLHLGGFASSTTALNTQGNFHAGGSATIDSDTGIGTTTPAGLGARLAVQLQSGYGIYTWNTGSGDSLFDDSGAKLTAAGTFTNAPSWSWYKENLIEPADYLGKIRGLPIYEWQYKNEVLDNNNRYSADPYRHVSPFLDDFNNTFGVGPGNGVNLQDWVGVALVGVKELDKKIDQKIEELNNLLAQSQAQINVTSQQNNAMSLPVIESPAADLTTLVVRESAIFYGNLYVAGEAGFGVKVTFYQDVEVKGKLAVSKDQAGSAAMPAGATTTEIIFEQPYARTPVIVATLVDDAENEEDSFRPYKISSKSVNGFKIIMRKPMSRDVNFDWIALAVSSGGTNPPIVNEPLVNNNQPATNNESSSSNEPLAENNGGGSGSAEQTNTESENQELSDNQPTAEPEPTSSEQPLSESEIMPGSEVSLDSTNQPDVQLEVSETPVPQTSEPVVSEPAPADQPIASEPAPAETPTASASNETAASEPISPATEAAPSVEASTN